MRNIEPITAVRPYQDTPYQPKGKRDKLKLYPPEPLYIAMEWADLSLYQDEVKLLCRLWLNGASVEQIAEVLGKHTDEVAVHIISLGHEGKLGPRHVGIFGNRCATPEV